MDTIYQIFAYALPIFLILFLAWFVYGVWFTKSYAPPTSSVAWIGVVISGIGFYFYHYGAMPTLWIFFTLAFVVVPIRARMKIDKAGRFWKVVRSKDAPLLDLINNVGSSKYKSWPYWKFGYVAVNPLPLPRMPRIYDDKGEYFLWEGKVEQTYDLESCKCDIEISYSYSAKITQNNLKVMLNTESTFDPEEIASWMWKKHLEEALWNLLGDHVMALARKAAKDYRGQRKETLTVKEFINPFKSFAPGLEFDLAESSLALKPSFSLYQAISLKQVVA